MLACSINGKVCTPEEARIPVDDHGLLYGDGVFEGLRFYGGQIFRRQAHLSRLLDSARAIGLSLPVDEMTLATNLDKVINASGIENGYIRLLVTRGSGYMGLDPSHCQDPRVIMIVDELAMVDPARRRQGISLIIASLRRPGPDQLDPRIKSLNYLNQILARMEAHAAGADEAIILNQAGRIAEGTADNVFTVRHGELWTPPVIEGALDGITRQAIIELASSLGIALHEAPMTTWDLYNADECFLTGTGAELIPVASLCGRPIGRGERAVFEALETAFQQLIDSETRASVL